MMCYLDHNDIYHPQRPTLISIVFANNNKLRMKPDIVSLFDLLGQAYYISQTMERKRERSPKRFMVINKKKFPAAGNFGIL